MNGYNLTDRQKELLRKLVRCVREEGSEQPISASYTFGQRCIRFFDGTTLEYQGDLFGDLDALCDAGLMGARYSQKGTKLYSIRQAGYDAVDNDFGAPLIPESPVIAQPRKEQPETLSVAQIFLCYAEEDEERVENLYQKLSDAGFKPWMAKKDLVGGEIWQLSIQQAIRRSDFVVVCLSAISVNKRSFVQREIKDALDIWREKLESDIYLIPVRLEDCEVPESLRDFQWVNLFEEDGWTPLVRAIQVGMEHRAEVPADEKPSPAGTELAESEISKKDLEMLETFYPCFDRYAFKDPMRIEEHISFIKAIRDTKIALSTGVIRLHDKTIIRKTKGKASFDSQDLRKAFDCIVDLLDAIEKRWAQAIRDGEIVIRGDGCPAQSESILIFMDETRNKIIDLVNKVYTPLGKTPFPRIPKIPASERKPGFRLVMKHVKFLSKAKGYGFIEREDGDEVFVHFQPSPITDKGLIPFPLMIFASDASALCRVLMEQFDLEEMRTLCWDLDVDFDSLRGEGKEAKAHELVAYLWSRNRLSQLIEYIHRHRPDII